MTTFKEIRGTTIEVVSSDPSNPEIGQIWYNSSSGTLKGYMNFSVNTWSAGGNLATTRLGLGGFGIQTAALAFGGQPAATTPTSLSESYNGTSWTSTPTLNTGRLYLATGAGTQTAGLGFGGATVPGSADSTASESWNGSSWTSTPSLNSARRNAGGAGIQTAALAFGGNGPGPLSSTEIWNSTSWTNSPATLNTAREGIAGFGTQTAAISSGGGNGTFVESYNGSVWTNINSLNTLRNINIYNWTWKTSLSSSPVEQFRLQAGTSDTGVIAQQLSAYWMPSMVDSVMPDRRLEPNGIEYARVNYGLLMPLIMSAIKEMSITVQQLSG